MNSPPGDQVLHTAHSQAPNQNNILNIFSPPKFPLCSFADNAIPPTPALCNLWSDFCYCTIVHSRMSCKWTHATLNGLCPEPSLTRRLFNSSFLLITKGHCTVWLYRDYLYLHTPVDGTGRFGFPVLNYCEYRCSERVCASLVQTYFHLSW